LHFWVTKSKRQQFSLQLLHMLLLSWVCSHDDHVLNSQLWQQLGDNIFLVHCGTASRCIIFAIRNRAQEKLLQPNFTFKLHNMIKTFSRRKLQIWLLSPPQKSLLATT
jgi:hypothetical protein